MALATLVLGVLSGPILDLARQWYLENKGKARAGVLARASLLLRYGKEYG